MPVLVSSSRLRLRRLHEAGDAELVAKMAVGDEEALDVLMDRKTQPLLQLAFRVTGNREEARDIVQLGFLRAWEHAKRYDSRWSANTWLYRIVTNLAIDSVRAQKRRDRQAEPLRFHISRSADSRDRRRLGRLQQAEVTRILHELSQHLSEKQRLAFVLREIEGLSSKDVGRILECRESTVRNHVFCARKILRAELVRRYPEYAAGEQVEQNEERTE